MLKEEAHGEESEAEEDLVTLLRQLIIISKSYPYQERSEADLDNEDHYALACDKLVLNLGTEFLFRVLAYHVDSRTEVYKH